MASTSRLRRALDGKRRQGQKACGLFVTCGFPTIEDTLPVLRALDEGGVDFMELGMPFSDPLAEGPVIQRSSASAIAAGVDLETALDVAADFRSGSDTPLLLMGYLNPIQSFGIRSFCSRARVAGVDGLILPELPPEEAGLIREAAGENELDLVFLIAPNTPDDRIRLVDEAATGFVYAVSFTGLTGAALDDGSSEQQYLQRARRLVSRNPLLVGFGITNREQAGRMSRHTDGFIVGSALIRRIESLWEDRGRSQADRLAELRAFAESLRIESV